MQFDATLIFMQSLEPPQNPGPEVECSILKIQISAKEKHGTT